MKEDARLKVLVTGGTGFIGASVVRNLLARGVRRGDRRICARRRGPRRPPRRRLRACRRRRPKGDRSRLRAPSRPHPLHPSRLSDERRGRGRHGARRHGEPARHGQHVRGGPAPQAHAARFHEQRDSVRRLASGLRRPAGRRGRLLRPERSFLHLRGDEDPRRIHGAQIRRQARDQHRLHPSRRRLWAWPQAWLGLVGGGFRDPAGARPRRRPAVLPAFARHLDLQGRLRRAARAPRAEAVPVAFRLQQRRRERDGGGAGRRGAPLAARRPVQVRRDEADDAADRPPRRSADRGGNRFRAAPAARRRARAYQRSAEGGGPRARSEHDAIPQHSGRQLSASDPGRRHDEEADAHPGGHRRNGALGGEGPERSRARRHHRRRGLSREHVLFLPEARGRHDVRGHAAPDLRRCGIRHRMSTGDRRNSRTLASSSRTTGSSRATPRRPACASSKPSPDRMC